MLNRTFLIGASLCYFFCWISLLSPTAHAQERADNNWIFGPNGGIRFNFSNDSLADNSPNAQPLGQGSSAVATDPQSGEVLFYADGSVVYDAQGNTFPMVGDADGAQNVAISPVPGSPNEYYVFVTNPNGDVVYYTVTVNKSGPGYPQISAFNGPTAINNFDNAEALTLIPNPDGSGYWLVSKIAGTSTYQYAEITSAGIQPPDIYQATGASNIGISTGLDFNAATNQLAVAGPNGFHILNFDPGTGTFGFVNSSNTPAYDVAWSADGSKLYISDGAGGNVFQYNLSNSPPNLTTLTNALGLGGAAVYGIQRGPDGSVYLLYEDAGQFLLGSINSADSAANLLSYETALLNGADFGGRRFSETAPAATPDYTFGVNQVGQCANNPVQLLPQFPQGTPQPDSIVWEIDGQPFSGFSPSFTPEQAASYVATAYWGDTSVSIPGSANVQEFDLQVPLVQDTTICPGETALLKAEPESGGQGGGGQGGGGGTGGGGNYQYYWSTGETTPEIEVNEAGVYWVLVSDPSSGCTAYAESNVKEYQVENQTYNVWYFGNGAGIDFNTLYDDPDNPDDGQITPIGDGAQTAPEGVGAVSDGNGDILFYTDGQSVFFRDRISGTHIPLTDPNGQPVQIGSNESTMVGMVQVPGADGVYYIFTTTPSDDPTGGYELTYSIVDLKQQAIVSTGNLLFAKSTERVTIYGGNGSSATLVAHEYGNNTFRTYPITEQGIGNPVLSSVGSVHELDNPAEAQGYMKIGGDSTGTILAVVIPGDNPRVELFNLDQQTGQITDPVSVDFSGQNAQPYGVEILTDTLNNTVLVVTTDNGLYSAIIDRPVVEGSAVNIIRDPDFSGNFGAVQRGPDGQLYVAQEGSSQLTAISVDPNTGDISAGNTVELPGGATSGLGLPDNIQTGGNSFPDPAITVDNACVGNEISFSAQGRDDVIETYSWEIVRQSDGLNVGLPDSLVTEQSFTFTLDEVGSYIARVTLSNPCDADTVLTQTFEVGQAAEVTLPESVNLCNGEVEVTAIDPNTPDIANYTFTWVQVGATGGGNLPNQNTISISEGGDYTVTVTNADGCESEGTVFVVDNRPEINLPEDFTLCQGETRELDVEIPSPRRNPSGYEWVILDDNDQTVATSEEPVIEVSELTPDPGVYRYTVTVTDDAPEGCFIQDTVVVTIEEAPVLGEPTTVDPECGEEDGSITLDLGGADPSALSFSWVDPNGSPFIATETATGLASGNYQVTVTNVTGCSFTQTIGLDNSDAPFEILSANGVPGCEEDGFIDLTVDISALTGSGFFDINITGIPENFSFQYNTANGPEANYILPAVPSLAPGNYNIQITERLSGCIRTSEAEILEPDSVEFEFVESPLSACGPTATIEVDYDLSFGVWQYRWFRPDGSEITVSNNQNPSLTLRNGTDAPGVYMVEVTNLSQPNLCPGSEEINVTFGDPFTFNIVEIEPDNSCQTGEKQLTVNFDPEDAAERDLIYNWTLNGQSVGALRTITVSESGSYELSVRERNNSACVYTDELPVEVSQPLSVTLLYGNACADGSAIPLFASVRTEGTDSLIYRWFRPDGTRIQASNPPPTGAGDSLQVLSDMPEGQYRVEVETAVGGCFAEASASITRNPLPDAELGATRIICTQDPDPEVNSALLEVGFAPEIYWYTPKGDFVNTTNVVADIAGTYTVEIINEFGCSIIDSVEVVDDCRPRIVAPNAFRPGGVNNTFFVYPKYVAAEDFEVKIYNRWGELVYQSTSVDFQWDGTYKGKDAPLGTYPYVIKYKSSTDETGELLEQRGGVAIIR
ncbi:T9SS type B sorting domain-containing protein [Catalinimonas niigatensis]|uniref:T9SS type B sorting domain-containing protein n=1 Tax=Catalinimonas niigatensis TaxID=1397264 RepID=UPI002665A9D6|nr:gliding motility-associated C-terminal domain-containing protein [Catalinimonas niigatensis]WPP48543.1 gliding motility-associated C-terminal domain-containing protein [Catalinimonas niigatensis]